MSEDREELLNHYLKTRADLLAAIDGLSDERMSEKTIDGWSVKDHLVHIAFWDEIRAREVERISAGHDSAWKMSNEQDAAANELANALRAQVSAAQARWEIESSRKHLLEAIAAATPRGLNGSLYGEAGLRSSHEEQHAQWIKTWRDKSDAS